ncbi:MAG: hypothetical protein B7Z31_00215 [Rhodobacterales bacterium 12-65-15]|nr:MAG: hypothetical protein B7Z31_00215 [Rhodobacterales bacterium 12-65-15]
MAGKSPSRTAIENSANARRDKSDARFLKALKGKRMTSSSIAKDLGTTSQNIQHKMQSMEERGLIRRVGFQSNATLWGTVTK